MKRMFFALLLVLPQAVSAQQEELIIYVVGPSGSPKANVEMKLDKQTEKSNQYGEVKFQVDKNVKENYIDVEVIKGEVMDREATLKGEPARGNAAFVLPVWTPQQIDAFANRLVKNPTHYAIAIRSLPGEPVIIVAKYEDDDGNIDAWIEKVAPNLPAVVMPELAQQLYAEEVGAVLPAKYAGQLRELDQKVREQRLAFQAAMRNPGQARPVPPEAEPPERDGQTVPAVPAGPPGPPGPVDRGGFSATGSIYSHGGVPLHSYDLHGGSSSGRGYYGDRGVPGMRITEWPSTSTGLTLSEEQRMGLNSGVAVSQCLQQAGSCPLPLKKPDFNIPDYVW